MKISELEELVGGLSKTSKMPCPSWSISAKRCLVGSKLALHKGTICEGCYALAGMYAFKNMQDALERRFACYSADPVGWGKNMGKLINRKQLDYFRWFDSGDLQSLVMLEEIVNVAIACPSTRFWLPTKQISIVSEWLKANGDFPSNLTVRISAYMRDKMPPNALAIGHLPCSTVTDAQSPIGYACPSKDQGNKCRDCRACWNKETTVISYYWH